MTRKLPNFTILLLVLTMLAGITDGQETRRFMNPSNVPMEGASPTDFVPGGWRIEKQIEGDLNGDSKPDVVLELIESLAPTRGDAPNERYRALFILMRTETGKLSRIAVADRLLRCSTCFGMLAGPEGGEPDIKILRGVIIINHLWGSRESVESTLRFRYDSQLKRVVLIGEDIKTRDRLLGTTISESSNYLTGVKITEGKCYDERRKQVVNIPPKRESIPMIKKFLEEIDYEDY